MTRFVTAIGVAALAITATGCGDLVSQGRSPSQLSIVSLTASAGGAEDDEFTSVLQSDVLTNGSAFNDIGQVSLGVLLKDQGVGTTPTTVNSVTITGYRVQYKRTDGRNTPGVDIPYAFDSAFTLTIPAGGSGSATFDLVKQAAKREEPLAGLKTNPIPLTIIADVTFFGHDQAGNDLSVTGSIGITFANFPDPD